MPKSKPVPKRSRPTPLRPKLPFDLTNVFLLAFGLICAGYFVVSGLAASNPIVGPDTSNWQTYLNAGTAYSQGYRIQIMKATEGLSFQDGKFGTSLANAKKAGLIPGPTTSCTAVAAPPKPTTS